MVLSLRFYLELLSIGCGPTVRFLPCPLRSWQQYHDVRLSDPSYTLPAHFEGLSNLLVGHGGVHEARHLYLCLLAHLNGVVEDKAENMLLRLQDHSDIIWCGLALCLQKKSI